MQPPKLIEFNITAKDDCWLKISSSLLLYLSISLKTSLQDENFGTELRIKNLQISFCITCSKEKLSLIEEYIKSYALVLLHKKPINDLYTEQMELIKFKQQLDLSALELKINRDSEESTSQDNFEIFNLHSNLANYLLEAVQLKS
jgi:hypothetical protein